MNNQILITLNRIKTYHPCASGWRKVLHANGGVDADLNDAFPVSSILDSNDMADTIWTLRCLPEYDQLWCRFAWFCATQVAHFCSYDGANKIIKMLAVIDRFLKGDASAEGLRHAIVAADTYAAYAGADAADAYAYAVYTASDAASDAAKAAASDAAKAAASDAASDAAKAAHDAAKAAHDADITYVIEHKLREILDAGEWVGRISK